MSDIPASAAIRECATGEDALMAALYARVGDAERFEETLRIIVGGMRAAWLLDSMCGDPVLWS